MAQELEMVTQGMTLCVFAVSYVITLVTIECCDSIGLPAKRSTSVSFGLGLLWSNLRKIG